MAPLIALIAGLLSARLAGLAGIDSLDGWLPALRGGLFLMFVLTGTAHFIPNNRRDFIAMVPPRLPYAGYLVAATGVLELAGAIGLLVPATARPAAGCLALLMVAMFPANISATRRSLTFNGRAVTNLPVRTILQCLFVGAAAAAAFA